MTDLAKCLIGAKAVALIILLVPGFSRLCLVAIGHEKPGFAISRTSLFIGGTQYGTSCHEGFWEAAQRNILQPNSASGAFALGIMYTELRKRAEENRAVMVAKERSTAMLAALNASNEVLSAPRQRHSSSSSSARPQSKGQFTSTVIALAHPDSDRFRIVAATGSAWEVLSQITLSVLDDVPEGRGLAATAFRKGQPCISNNYLPMSGAFHDIARSTGTQGPKLRSP